jgi:hypothetical protein
MNGHRSTGTRMDVPLHLDLSPLTIPNYIKFYRPTHVKSVKG